MTLLTTAGSLIPTEAIMLEGGWSFMPPNRSITTRIAPPRKRRRADGVEVLAGVGASSAPSPPGGRSPAGVGLANLAARVPTSEAPDGFRYATLAATAPIVATAIR